MFIDSSLTLLKRVLQRYNTLRRNLDRLLERRRRLFDLGTEVPGVEPGVASGEGLGTELESWKSNVSFLGPFGLLIVGMNLLSRYCLSMG
jgi:hypothetical protein